MKLGLNKILCLLINEWKERKNLIFNNIIYKCEGNVVSL